MKIFRFRYVYLFSFIFWISMTAWFSFILLKKERGIAYQSQFTPTGDRFLFQEKKFVIAQRDSIFGVMTSFFSLSDSISFEWDLSINYLYNSQEISQKVYGKIEADRLRNIRDINVILKSTKDNSEDVSLTSFRGMFRNNALLYDIIIKKDENRQMSGDIPVKGEYWLINPVYPFGRNMRYIREDKKRTTFYNPWSRKFERIEYTVTGKKESINGEKAMEVQAMFYGVTYSLFLSPTGELLQVSFPSGLSIRQVPSDLNVEPEMFLNLEKIFREMVRNIRKDYKNKGKKND